jgi:hypothetical protein
VNPRRHAVNLHAVAGRKENNFIKPAAQLEAAAAALETRALDGQLLTHLHGRGLVAQSCDKDFHKLVPAWLRLSELKFNRLEKLRLPFFVI